MTSSLFRRRIDRRVLARLLEDPELAVSLRALPPPALRQLIVRVGLADAGELVALASVEQLRDVFDEDLWRSATPGGEEDFDADRFAAWLEVLLEGGERLLADRLVEMSDEFLIFAVSRLVRVMDVSVLVRWSLEAHQAELLDEIVDAFHCEEFEEYLLVSRRAWGWDAVWAAILALDRYHPERLRSVLACCAAATHEEVRSADGLRAALDGDELLREDAAAERDERRGARGYVSPADARAFLGLAEAATDSADVDPITRSHFRRLARTAERAAKDAPAVREAEPPALRRLLLDAGVELDAAAPARATDSLFRRSLDALFDSDPAAHQRVIEELAYLANVLIAGDTSTPSPWRPVDAAQRVLELCDAGLRTIAEREGIEAGHVGALLTRYGAVGAFRAAWAARSCGEDAQARR